MRVTREPGRLSRPIWEAEILQYRPTFVSAALAGTRR